MELLEYFYDRNNDITHYQARKFNIPNNKRILIYGSPASGKTSLALDYLMNYDSESILYLDFSDPKFQFKDIMEEDVDGFVQANKIELLVLDHYQHEYFENLPTVTKLIIISDRFFEYEDFTSLNIPLLDYEEFFAFQKGSDEKQIFNSFLKRGSLPELALQNSSKEQLFLRFLQSHFTESEQKLLTLLAYFNGSSISTFQLYTHAKERYKISKDLIYKQIKDFESKKVITFITDVQNPKQKKLLFFDFALAKYLSLNQMFPKQFETMVALSLIKHNIPIKSFGLNAYITDTQNLILPAPFETEDSFWKKAQTRFTLYKKQKIKKVSIVTVASNFEFTIEDIEFEALPFYEWVVINDEY